MDVPVERGGVQARVRNTLARLLPAALLATCALLPVPSHARSHGPAAQGLGEPVALSRLPVQAQRTASLIRSGGPFPFDKDGVVFGNRERRLPRRPSGYYHEYTVPTPGSRDRGARRIVCGGRVLTEPEGCFYTEDHYGSFHRILGW